MIEWKEEYCGTLLNHMGSVNGKEVVMIRQGCFSQSLRTYDDMTGESEIVEKYMNKTSLKDIKLQAETLVQEK